MIVITPRIDMDFGSGWEDVSEDVISAVKAHWGIHGGGVKDRVADAGGMTFDLDNSSRCSGGLRGYYSPGHDDVRSGFALGIPARLVLNHPLFGDKVMWVGTVTRITPNAGVKSPSTSITCEDWMGEAGRAKLSGIEVQTDVQSDALFLTLVGAVEKQPPGGAVAGSGSDVYPFALDNVQDEKSKVLEQLQQLAMSEVGIIYVSAGVLTFEGRRRRGGGGAIRFAMDEDEEIVAIGQPTHDRDDVITRAQVSIHPRREDDTPDTVLFNLGSAIQIARNTSVTINCPYRDPNQQAQRVGGVDMQDPDPVEGDYIFNTSKDGLGTDITNQLDVDAVFGGNSAVVTITNNGPSDGYVPANGLKLRGRGLYDFEPVLSDRRDDDSSEAFGENVLTYDMPYQSDPNNATDLAQFILALNKDPKTRVRTVTFVANWSDEVAEQAFNLQISDRISLTAPSIGLDAQPFFVNGVSLDVRMNGVVVVIWDLSPVDTSQFWQLEVDGRTELDETTILGYGLFVAGWILDTSELGTDTFVN